MYIPEEFEVEMDIPTIEERIEVTYSDFEKRILKRKQSKWNTDIEQMEDNLSQLEIPEPLFYPNHIEVSHKCIQSLDNKKKVIEFIIGRTQSGKTAAMLCIINDYINDNLIDTDNIYIITGLSSTDWVEQTKKRMPENLHKNIYHNGQLKEFKMKVKEKKNVLLLIDEAHMASRDNQTINTIWNDLGWTLDYMLENDIKLVFMTATPDGIAFAMQKWPKDRYNIHIMKSGEGYYGTRQMLERGKLLEAKELSGKYDEDDRSYDITDEIESNWCEIIRNHLTFDTPKYLIVRMKSPYDEANYFAMFKYVLKNNFSDKIHLFSKEKQKYSMDGDISDLNSGCLKNAPLLHSLILIKNKLMCAITIVKENIGSMVDRPTKNGSFVIQSFAGRACGYITHNIITYTAVELVKDYEKMYDKEFNNISSIPWNSNTTKVIRGETISKKVYASADARGVEDKDEKVFKSIPVKILFINDPYRKKLFLQNDRSTFNRMLLEGIETGLIDVHDKNITKFQTRHTLHSVRNYKKDSDIKSRRFKGFNKAYTENKPMSQKCPEGTYCIDIASYEFEDDGFINPVNIGWITFM